MLLAKFGPHRDDLQDAFIHSCHPSLEDNEAIAKWTCNVLVDALIRIITIPDEDMKPWIAWAWQTNHVALWVGGLCPQQPKYIVSL